MVEEKGKTEVKLAQRAGEHVLVHELDVARELAGGALLVLRRPQGEPEVGVAQGGVQGQHLIEGLAHVLVPGQGLHLEEPGGAEAEVHLLRGVPDQVPLEVRAQGVPLPAHLGGSEQIVEVRPVVGVGRVEVVAVVVRLYVKTLVRWNPRVGGVRGRERDLVKGEGVGKIERHPVGGILLVPLGHRVGRGQPRCWTSSGTSLRTR